MDGCGTTSWNSGTRYRELPRGRLLGRDRQVVELAVMKTTRFASRRPAGWRALATRVFALGVLLAPSCTPEPKPFLWRIEGQPPSYLFGTVHVPDTRVTTLPVIVRRSFRASDVLLTEVPFDQMGKAAELTVSGQTLRELLPEDLYRRVSAYFEANKIPMQRIEPLAVWAVLTTILQVEATKLNRTGDIHDKMLWEHGVDQRKQLGGLATPEEQVAVFDEFTLEEQRVMLEGTLDQVDEQKRLGKNMFEELIEIYRRGDENELQQFAMQSSGLEGHEELEAKFTRVIVDERNEQMAERMIERMKAAPDKTHFFAVGAMHYAGEKSILALLRAQGYEVTRL